MKVADKIRGLPAKVKKQLKTAVLLTCALATFAVPAFGDGYSILKPEEVESSAAAIEDVDLLLVAASAFGEARKAMYAFDPDGTAKTNFINNTTQLIGKSVNPDSSVFKWQNIGLIVGARDALSGSIWSAYQSPVTLSWTEVDTYGSDEFKAAYQRYKAFGYAVQLLNNQAKVSDTAAVSLNDGLDSMSKAAIKLGGFGVEFLDDYNPGPVLLSLYDISYMRTYSQNKLIKIVNENDVLYNIVNLFGSKVPGTGLSFFVILNAVLAVFGLALSMLLTLLGNRDIGQGIRGFLVRIVVGTVGIYLIANFMSIALDWVTNTVGDLDDASTVTYIQTNLNLYDWYLCGFAMPNSVEVQIDSTGHFVWTREAVEAVNKYTYDRIYGGEDPDVIKAHMESNSQTSNIGHISLITPSSTSGDGSSSTWATDVYYAFMDNYSQNKDNMADDGGDPNSPLAGISDFSIYQSKYLWMSSLTMTGGPGNWTVKGSGGRTYYGLNPISAYNLVRSNFAGDSIQASANVNPELAYVAYNVTSTSDVSGDRHMNSITRFIACFTMILAAMKGLITIFTAGFGGIIQGGVKTATGSSHGLGQALGGVIAVLGGVIGISVIMSMSLSLLDTIYGIACELLTGTELIDTFLQPIQDTLGQIKLIGPLIMGAASSVVEWILTLILSLTFPKLGGIPITVFAQYMSELPGRIAERAQMIEGMLFAGRMGGHGGLPPRPHGGGGGASGKMARAMAGQAFSSGARQAAAVMAAGASAAGALAGASLSTLGGKMADKADHMEGKPENPGLDNWDELTPEQQAAAATAAMNDDDWDNKSQEERQQYLQDQGVLKNGDAEGPSTSNQSGDTETPETPTESAPVEGEDSGGHETPTEPGTPAAPPTSNPPEVTGQLPPETVQTPTGEQSIAAQTPTGEGKDGGNGTIDTGSSEDGGTGSSDIGDSDEPPVNEITEESLNNEETLDQDIQQDALNVADEKSVSQDNILNDEDAQNEAYSELNSSAEITGANGNNNPNGNPAANGVGGELPETHGDSNKNPAAPTTGNAQEMAVSNLYNTEGSTAMTQNTGMQVTADNSVSDTTQNSQTNTQQGAQQAGKSGASSVNDTVKSKWGKEMSVKDQKNARLMRSVGHAMQAAGGNRTMKQGAFEAMGHLKDAAVAYTVPIELQNAETHPFLGSVHQRRVAKEKEKKEAQKNGKK